MDRIKIYHEEIKVGIGVLEDDADFRREFKALLLQRGLENHALFATGEELLSNIKDDWHIVLIDHYGVGGKDGYEIMLEVLKKNDYCFVIIFSAQESMDVVIKYLNGEEDGGAYAYVNKNGKTEKEAHDELMHYIDRALKEIQADVVYFSSLDKRIQQAEKRLLSNSNTELSAPPAEEKPNDHDRDSRDV